MTKTIPTPYVTTAPYTACTLKVRLEEDAAGIGEIGDVIQLEGFYRAPIILNYWSEEKQDFEPASAQYFNAEWPRWWADLAVEHGPRGTFLLVQWYEEEGDREHSYRVTLL